MILSAYRRAASAAELGAEIRDRGPVRCRLPGLTAALFAAVFRA